MSDTEPMTIQSLERLHHRHLDKNILFYTREIGILEGFVSYQEKAAFQKALQLGYAIAKEIEKGELQGHDNGN